MSRPNARNQYPGSTAAMSGAHYLEPNKLFGTLDDMPALAAMLGPNNIEALFGSNNELNLNVNNLKSYYDRDVRIIQVVTAVNENRGKWQEAVFPMTYVDNLAKTRVETLSLDLHRPVPIAPYGRVPVVEYKRSSEEFTIEQYGIGAEWTAEDIQGPDATRQIAMKMRQCQNTVMYVMNTMGHIYVKHAPQVTKMIPDIPVGTRVGDMFKFYSQSVFAVSRSATGLFDLNKLVTELRLQINRPRPDVLVIPQNTISLVAQSDFFKQYYTFGAGNQKFLTNPREAANDLMRDLDMAIFEDIPSFVKNMPGEIENHMRETLVFGSMHCIPPSRDLPKPDTANYSTNHVFGLNGYSLGGDNWHFIPADDLIANDIRFDFHSGGLRTDLLSEIANNYQSIATKCSWQIPTHVMSGRTEPKIDPFIGFDRDMKPFVVSKFGEVTQDAESRFDSIARSIVARISDKFDIKKVRALKEALDDAHELNSAADSAEFQRNIFTRNTTGDITDVARDYETSPFGGAAFETDDVRDLPKGASYMGAAFHLSSTGNAVSSVITEGVKEAKAMAAACAEIFNISDINNGVDHIHILFDPRTVPEVQRPSNELGIMANYIAFLHNMLTPRFPTAVTGGEAGGRTATVDVAQNAALKSRIDTLYSKTPVSLRFQEEASLIDGSAYETILEKYANDDKSALQTGMQEYLNDVLNVKISSDFVDSVFAKARSLSRYSQTVGSGTGSSVPRKFSPFSISPASWAFVNNASLMPVNPVNPTANMPTNPAERRTYARAQMTYENVTLNNGGNIFTHPGVVRMQGGAGAGQTSSGAIMHGGFHYSSGMDFDQYDTPSSIDDVVGPEFATAFVGSASRSRLFTQRVVQASQCNDLFHRIALLLLYSTPVTRQNLLSFCRHNIELPWSAVVFQPNIMFRTLCVYFLNRGTGSTQWGKVANMLQFNGEVAALSFRLSFWTGIALDNPNGLNKQDITVAHHAIIERYHSGADFALLSPKALAMKTQGHLSQYGQHSEVQKSSAGDRRRNPSAIVVGTGICDILCERDTMI
ncbi:hypothetical protein KDA14_01230, partial [Candidatus Saccharibacteria bacterium]|nr:hypothetical protein [Candidatus Saccharibacteria bacterium]